MVSTIWPSGSQLQTVRPTCVQVATCLAQKAAQLQLAKAHASLQLGVRALAAWQAGAGAQQEKRSKQRRRVSEIQVRLSQPVQRFALPPDAASTYHLCSPCHRSGL